MDSRPTQRGDRSGGAAKDAFHSGVGALRHPQGHPLRQHSGQVEEDGRARGGRPHPGRGKSRARVLLRRVRLTVQSAHQKVAEGGARLRGEAETVTRS